MAEAEAALTPPPIIDSANDATGADDDACRGTCINNSDNAITSLMTDIFG